MNKYCCLYLLLFVGFFLNSCNLDPLHEDEEFFCGNIVADFSISAQNDTLRAGEVINFTNASNNANTYLWDFGDGNGSDLVSPPHIYQDWGNYQVQLRAIDGNCQDQISKSIFVRYPGAVRTFGGSAPDVGSAVIRAKDGGYVVVGSTESFGAFGKDVYLMKTDSNGFETWFKKYDRNFLDVGFSVVQTQDGGYIIAGFTETTGSNIYLIKVDSNGEVIWQKDDYGVGIAYSIIEVSTGGYAITGAKNSNIYIMKIDEEGNILWDRSFGDSEHYDTGKDVLETSDQGFIIVGSTQTFGNANSDIYLLKLDATGETQWNKIYGDPVISEYAKAIIETENGNFLLISDDYNLMHSESPISSLKKINAMGNLIWERTFSGEEEDVLEDLKETDDGGFILVGHTTTVSGSGDIDILLMKTYSSGVMEWRRTYGTDRVDRGYGLEYFGNKGYAIVGYSANVYSTWDIDLAFFVTDLQGSLLD